MSNERLETTLDQTDDIEVPLDSPEPKLPKKDVVVTIPEARQLVDLYYQTQEHRKALGNQILALEKAKESSATLKVFFDRFQRIEGEAKRALDRFSLSTPTGRAARSVMGIGPVIAAGLLAHIDITRAPTAGHVWRFAGLDPTVEWIGAEGARKLVADILPARCPVGHEHLLECAAKTNRRLESIERQARDPETGAITRESLIGALAKRPWNATLRTLSWKIGESFMKCGEKSYYGRVYAERKRLEHERNARHEYRAQAEQTLQRKNYGKATIAYGKYSEGLLPDAHIHARAKRYAVKLFLSHYHHVAYLHHFGQDPPRPYVVEHLGHAHYVRPEEAGWEL